MKRGLHTSLYVGFQYFTLSLVFSFLMMNVAAQGTLAAYHSPPTPPKQPFIHQDTSIHSIKDFFKKSHFSGHIRNSFMATINQGELSDYWTNATGGAIKLETPEFLGLQFGVEGIFTHSTATGDLLAIDSLTGKSAKWEREQYDVLRPGEYHDLDRLEELYLKWNFGQSSYVAYGKMDLNTGPLFLKRDGRMKPFVYRGLWSEINELPSQKITLGWLNGVSPRGMTEWFSMQEVIGINNNGVQSDGTAAHYHETAETKGIGVVGYQNQLPNISGLKLEVWNFYFHNLFNMNWLQLDYRGKHWLVGMQYVYQTALAHQNTLSYEQRYIQPNEDANVLSAQFGYQNKPKGWEVSGAFLHSFGTGRFLFPRELGRENFYVSQPRSWIDGQGDSNAWMLRFKYQPQKRHWKHFKLDTRFVRILPSDRDEARFNKYKVSPYYQATILARYKFSHLMKGLSLGLLYVGRFSEDKLDLSYNQTFYKTNFHHMNLIANIKF